MLEAVVTAWKDRDWPTDHIIYYADLEDVSLPSQRYNNLPPYVTARWLPQQIPLLNFLGVYATLQDSILRDRPTDEREARAWAPKAREFAGGERRTKARVFRRRRRGSTKRNRQDTRSKSLALNFLQSQNTSWDKLKCLGLWHRLK